MCLTAQVYKDLYHIEFSNTEYIEFCLAKYIEQARLYIDDKCGINLPKDYIM